MDFYLLSTLFIVSQSSSVQSPYSPSVQKPKTQISHWGNNKILHADKVVLHTTCNFLNALEKNILTFRFNYGLKLLNSLKAKIFSQRTCNLHIFM